MKERQISARQLDYGDTHLGSRTVVFPRARSRSPRRADVQSCEVVRNDVQQGESCSAEGYDDECGFVRGV